MLPPCVGGAYNNYPNITSLADAIKRRVIRCIVIRLTDIINDVELEEANVEWISKMVGNVTVADTIRCIFAFLSVFLCVCVFILLHQKTI